jgi:hypothetical protein
MLPPAPNRFRKPASGAKSPQRSGLSSEQKVPDLRVKQNKNSSKLNERPANVYENKGSLRKTLQESQNVYENKGT